MVATKAKEFRDWLMRKSVYATGWDGTIVVSCGLDGGYRTTASTSMAIGGGVSTSDTLPRGEQPARLRPSVLLQHPTRFNPVTNGWVRLTIGGVQPALSNVESLTRLNNVELDLDWNDLVAAYMSCDGRAIDTIDAKSERTIAFEAPGLWEWPLSAVEKRDVVSITVKIKRIDSETMGRQLGSQDIKIPVDRPWNVSGMVLGVLQWGAGIVGALALAAASKQIWTRFQRGRSSLGVWPVDSEVTGDRAGTVRVMAAQDVSMYWRSKPGFDRTQERAVSVMVAWTPRTRDDMLPRATAEVIDNRGELFTGHVLDGTTWNERKRVLRDTSDNRYVADLVTAESGIDYVVVLDRSAAMLKFWVGDCSVVKIELPWRD
jgi:hypothetical protein